MKIKIEISESDLKELIREHIEKITNLDVELNEIDIITKSKQNYKSEWEIADFKAEFKKN